MLILTQVYRNYFLSQRLINLIDDIKDYKSIMKYQDCIERKEVERAFTLNQSGTSGQTSRAAVFTQALV